MLFSLLNHPTWLRSGYYTLANTHYCAKPEAFPISETNHGKTMKRLKSFRRSHEYAFIEGYVEVPQFAAI
jgi:hypothetical protein